MKKLLLAALLITGITVQAQKINLVQKSTLTTSMSVMGNSMDIPVDGETFFTLDIKRNDGKKMELAYTLTRLKTATSVMGQDIKLDTDEKGSLDGNPAAATIKDAINKQENATLENGKVNGKAGSIYTGSNPTAASFLSDLLLSEKAKDKKQGDKWTDEIIGEDGTKSVIIYAISKIDGNNIEITSNATVAINGKQTTPMGEANQKMSGTITSVTLYDVKTNLMKGQATQLNMQGTVEAMGQEIPLTMKGTITTNIN